MLGFKGILPLWYQIATCFALSQSSKTFVIRSFFFEKWLLTHVFGGPRGQKSSCKQACIGFLTFWPWYYLSQSRRLPPLSDGEWQQICLSGSPISDWDKRSARMRSDSVKNMSAYADQNHAPSLAVARLEFLIKSVLLEFFMFDFISKF